MALAQRRSRCRGSTNTASGSPRVAAGGDLGDLALLAAVGDQVEVDVLAQRALGEDRDAAQVVEPTHVVGGDARRLEQLPPVADVVGGVRDQAAQAPELQLLQLGSRQPLRAAQLLQVARRVAADAGRAQPSAGRRARARRRDHRAAVRRERCLEALVLRLAHAIVDEGAADVDERARHHLQREAADEGLPGVALREERLDLPHRVALRLRHHRDHVLEVVEASRLAEDVLEDLAAVEHEAGLDVVLGHREGDLQQVVEAAAPVVAMVVLPLERAAPALDQVRLAEAHLAVEVRDRLGLVLQVGVDGADVAAARALEAALPSCRESPGSSGGARRPRRDGARRAPAICAAVPSRLPSLTSTISPRMRRRSKTRSVRSTSSGRLSSSLKHGTMTLNSTAADSPDTARVPTTGSERPATRADRVRSRCARVL